MHKSIEHLTWITDPHLEFCSADDRMALYESINNDSGQAVVITDDISAGRHWYGHYCELGLEVKKPIYFVLGNHDRYGTTFADTEVVCARACKEYSDLMRLDGSQVIPLSAARWASWRGRMGRRTCGDRPGNKIRVSDFYYIKDFAALAEQEVFVRMEQLARCYASALEKSLRQGLEQCKSIGNRRAQSFSRKLPAPVP